MNQFKNKKLTRFELNIMRGLFRRSLKDYADHVYDNSKKKTLYERLQEGYLTQEEIEKQKENIEKPPKVNPSIETSQEVDDITEMMGP